MTLDVIRDNIREGQYRFFEHAVKRMIRRSVSRKEIEEVILEGEIIEDSPSCLVYGKTGEGKPLHIQVAFPPVVVIITVYEPDPLE